MMSANVKVELFDWTTEAWKTNSWTQFGNTVQLGVVTIETDEGISGNSFLGSSRLGAEHHAWRSEHSRAVQNGRAPCTVCCAM